ncbi:UNVERIFIED_CONTAM: hypothetical protein Sindi_3104900 [Sesamum indicum]
MMLNPDSPRPVKIQDPVCSLNSNPAEIEEREHLTTHPPRDSPPPSSTAASPPRPPAGRSPENFVRRVGFTRAPPPDASFEDRHNHANLALNGPRTPPHAPAGSCRNSRQNRVLIAVAFSLKIRPFSDELTAGPYTDRLALMSRSFPPKQFRVSSTVNDGLSLRPQLGFSVDSPSLPPFHDRGRLPFDSSPSCASFEISHSANRRRSGRRFSAVPSPFLLAEHHHWPRLDKAQPPVPVRIGRRETCQKLHLRPTANSQHVLLTELTRSTVQVNHPLTGAVGFLDPDAEPSEKNRLLKLLRHRGASEIAKTAPHKYFLADSPQPAIGTILTGRPRSKIAVHRCGDRGLSSSIQIRTRWKIFAWSTFDYTRLWLRRIWYIQGYPMRVFKWTPTFTPSKESSIVPVWVSFPELPAHLFRKEVLFTVASMIGTPLQIDDGHTQSVQALQGQGHALNWIFSNRALRIFKSRFVGPLSCSVLSTRISHTTARGANMLGIETQTAIRKATFPSHPPEAEEGCCGSGAGQSSCLGSCVNEFSVPADEVNIPCEAGKMGDLPADNLVVSSVENIVETNLPSDNLVVGVVYPPIGGVEIQMRKKWVNHPQASKLFKNLKFFGMITPPLEEWDETDESEGEDDDVNPDSPRPVKIQDPVCSLNSNPAEIEEREQFFASPTPPRKIQTSLHALDHYNHYNHLETFNYFLFHNV